MFGFKGQAFDAFKLLIAAVVAGSILVIILSMLGGFITPGGSPVTVMAQTVQGLRTSPDAGTVSSQVVQFQKDSVISTKSVESKAGINPGTVFFCTDTGQASKGTGDVDPKQACSDLDTACPEGYSFSSNYFSINGNSLTATQKVSGKIWVYNCDGSFFIGFTTHTT